MNLGFKDIHIRAPRRGGGGGGLSGQDKDADVTLLQRVFPGGIRNRLMVFEAWHAWSLKQACSHAEDPQVCLPPPQGQVWMNTVHHGDLVVNPDQQLAEPLAQFSLVSLHQHIGLIITLVLQIRTLKQREIQQVPQGHPASEWQKGT